MPFAFSYVVIFAVVFFFYFRAKKRGIEKFILPISKLLTQSTQTTNLFFSRIRSEGFYKDRKIQCDYFFGKQKSLIIRTAVRIQTAKQTPWYQFQWNYPQVLPGFKLIRKDIVFRKPDALWFRNTEFDARSILDQLVQACEKVERGEFRPQ